jgi:diguanylate cyclase (GGDEF)-like protein
MRHSLAAFGTAFTAFQAGLEMSTLGTQVLTAPSTPAEVEGLIDANNQYESSVQGFPASLGPLGAAAWQAYSRSPQVRLFDNVIQLAIQVGLRREPAPYAADIMAHAGVFKAEVQSAGALTSLDLAVSGDLLAVTADQRSSATIGLVLDVLAMALLVIIALGGALLLSRAVRRPLARIVSAAGAVRAGEFDLPPVDESGPKELALAAGAFNEMTSTLRAVEAHAVALADNDLDNPVLHSPLPGRTGRAMQVSLDQLHKSMSAREEQRELLHHRATHDSLTGLLNRGAAVDALNRDLARARRGGQVVALLFIDLDRLKSINDTFGHEGGDAAIQAVAGALAATTRDGDIVARLGGDEFVVGCLGAPGKAGPARLAERIQQQMSSTVIEVDGNFITIGCSIGIALSEPSDLAVDSLMKRADQALYLAKAEGRGTVRWSDTATEQPGETAVIDDPAPELASVRGAGAVNALS